ncbi:MAG: OsmC family protein [Sphingomonadaceae bacterium]
MSNPTTAQVEEAQGSPFAVAIEVSGHHLFGDEPVDAGGRNLGPSPYDLLTAALGECTAMTVRWYARHQDWPVDHVSCTVRHERKMVEGHDRKIDVFHKTVTVRGDSLTDEQRQKLVEVAARCPVQKTLSGPVQIDTEAGI